MKKALLSLILIGAISTSAQAQNLVVGTEIGIDFGNNATASGGNFNEVTAVGGTFSGSLTSVTDTSGTTLTGVGFTWATSYGAGNSTNTTFFNDTADEAQGGLPSVFDSTHTTDWFGIASNPTRPDPNFMTLTFTGLNDAFTYNLIIGGAGGLSGIADTTWLVDGQSAGTVGDTPGSSYVSFTGLSTDGFGNLVITGTGAGDREDLAVVSAVHVTVSIPEPSSFALLTGLFCLTHIMLRRRR